MPKSQLKSRVQNPLQECNLPGAQKVFICEECHKKWSIHGVPTMIYKQQQAATP